MPRFARRLPPVMLVLLVVLAATGVAHAHDETGPDHECRLCRQLEIAAADEATLSDSTAVEPAAIGRVEPTPARPVAETTCPVGRRGPPAGRA